jgi:hypothetical protein
MPRTRGSGGRVVTVRNGGGYFEVPRTTLLNLRRLTSTPISEASFTRISYTTSVYVFASSNLSVDNTRSTSNIAKWLSDWQRMSKSLTRELGADSRRFPKHGDVVVAQLLRPLKVSIQAARHLSSELVLQEKRWKLIRDKIWLLWVVELSDTLAVRPTKNRNSSGRPTARETVNIIECITRSLPTHAVRYKTKQSIERKLGSAKRRVGHLTSRQRLVALAGLDILKIHLAEIGREDLIDSDLDIGTALEFGVSSRTLLSLPISRTRDLPGPSMACRPSYR